MTLAWSLKIQGHSVNNSNVCLQFDMQDDHRSLVTEVLSGILDRLYEDPSLRVSSKHRQCDPFHLQSRIYM